MRNVSNNLKGSSYRSKILMFLMVLVVSSSLLASGQVHIIPQPKSIEVFDDFFSLSVKTKILSTDSTREEALFLQLTLKSIFDSRPEIETPGMTTSNLIQLSIVSNDEKLNKEGYSLDIQSDKIVIHGSQGAGIFYGIQTLQQLILQNQKEQDATIRLPALRIMDEPTYRWRGMMLDVSRHFLDKEFIKRFLDMMAFHKLNTFHWHLIDDGGWRLEIKKYPRLTSVGSVRGEGTEYSHSGYYTQDDIRDILAYAKERHIRVIPEIEVPAHTLAALVAYPHLSCEGKQHKMPVRHFISRDLYCAGKEKTWEFLYDVFDEVCDLFPDTYIHIGGDEAKYDRWRKCSDCQNVMKREGLKNEGELQGWMNRRLEDYLQTKGKNVVGWEEYIKGNSPLSKKAVSMVWHKEKMAVEGARRGNPVVIAFSRKSYFDPPQSSLESEPVGATWIPALSLKGAYEWDPMPKELSMKEQNNILGAHGCMWTDQLHNNHDVAQSFGADNYVEYFCLPRMSALAEVVWTEKGQRDWAFFKARMKNQYQNYHKFKWNYRVPTPVMTVEKHSDTSSTISATSSIRDGVIRYTLDGSDPSLESEILDHSIKVSDTSLFRAATFTRENERRSVTFNFDEPIPQRLRQHGKKIGKWNASDVPRGHMNNLTFNATGKIRTAGTYQLSFLGTNRVELQVSNLQVFKNHELVYEDTSSRKVSKKSKQFMYKISIPEYETGAAYTITVKAISENEGESKGLVLIKKL